MTSRHTCCLGILLLAGVAAAAWADETTAPAAPAHPVRPGPLATQQLRDEHRGERIGVATVAGTMEVYPLENYGAIQTGSHRFYGLEQGKPDVLRESGRLFHVWKRTEGGWKLARVYSYDHRAAEE